MKANSDILYSMLLTTSSSSGGTSRISKTQETQRVSGGGKRFSYSKEPTTTAVFKHRKQAFSQHFQ